MTTKKPAGADWASRFSREATAVKEPPVEDEPTVEQTAGRPKRTSSRTTTQPPTDPEVLVPLRGPLKRPVTYRLVDADLDLVDAAVAAAAKQGQRLTKEDAVAQALRNTYGHLRASED